MHLIIDGYNLLHLYRSPTSMDSSELQRERGRLIDDLSAYRHRKPCNMTVVFDGWQGGWAVEKREIRKGIEIVFSKLGEKADEVIKRLIREKGSGSVLITSDRDLVRYAERMSVPAITSDRFREKMERSAFEPEREENGDEEQLRRGKRKGLSRRPSKKEKRARATLKKL